ncbi:hypothetical protein CDL15_Pgr001429 [Punica granatum]|uniref:Uncharacterized protein n=1 Tax=Punica granatum TaxID=22663 RepID=A0A218WKI9_PUNGR|nr:hypothetical protein CDL15_Pgr001429 [Punica granatum]
MASTDHPPPAPRTRIQENMDESYACSSLDLTAQSSARAQEDFLNFDSLKP